MPSLSSFIDVSSFFIGVLINLLLVALICYYFKKKFDVLRSHSQSKLRFFMELYKKNGRETK